MHSVASSRPLLIVEDSRAVGLALALLLRLKGQEVECASEEAEAIALLAHRRYAGVFVDLRLGEAESPNGLRILDYLQRNRPETRAVVLTAFGTPLLAREASRLGAVAFLTKPVEDADLDAALDILLAEEP
jgi:two-component system response regulator RegA